MNLYFSTGAAGKLKRKVDTMLEKVFKLSENKTTVKTEVVAGLTTFMTMAYIIALNPNLLTGFGAAGQDLWNGVFLATCIASAIGTFCMAFLANKPFAMAPGMGLNSFFAVVVGNIVAMTGMTYVASFQAALVIILLEGIVFVVLSIFNVREKIVEAIPLGIRLGISPAIGLMLMNIGLGSNVGVYAEGNGFTTPFYVMRDFFGAMTPSVIKDHMGAEYSQMVLTVITMFIGLFVIILLAKKGIKAAVLVGMLAASVIYWAGSAIFLHVNPFASLATASFVPPFADMVSTTLFKFDFAGFVNIGWFTAITLVITFCMIDMFDTIGTLVGTASRAGMVDQDGNMPQMKEALLSDAIGTVAGACTGTSTVIGVGIGTRCRCLLRTDNCLLFGNCLFIVLRLLLCFCQLLRIGIFLFFKLRHEGFQFPLLGLILVLQSKQTVHLICQLHSPVLNLLYRILIRSHKFPVRFVQIGRIFNTV